MSVLLAVPNRSGLRPSFPARPIRLLRLSAWSASLALPTAWPTMPVADSCASIRSPCGFLSSCRNGTQVSPGKFDRLHRTPAGSTGLVLDGCGLRDPLPARPTRCASYPVSVRQVAALLHTSFRRHLAMTPLCFANPSPPSGWMRDFHPQAIEHAGHTTNPLPRESAARRGHTRGEVAVHWNEMTRECSVLRIGGPRSQHAYPDGDVRMARYQAS
jgi:hypothetical protein